MTVTLPVLCLEEIDAISEVRLAIVASMDP